MSFRPNVPYSNVDCGNFLDEIRFFVKAKPDRGWSDGVYHMFTLWTNYNVDYMVTIPNTWQSLPSECFRDHSYKRLLIGKGITDLGIRCILYSWKKCSNGEPSVLIVLPTTPPTLGQVHTNSIDKVDIYVPDASIDAYKEATNWDIFTDRIHPISECPKEYFEPKGIKINILENII